MNRIAEQDSQDERTSRIAEQDLDRDTAEGSGDIGIGFKPDPTDKRKRPRLIK